MRKQFTYESHDGKHFPDAARGDNLYYSVDFSDWLSNENDNLTSVTWSVPLGITSEENFLVINEAVIKLYTNKVGTFKIVCRITSEENGKSQTKSVPMMLIVE